MDGKRLEWLLMNKLQFITCIVLLCCSVLSAQNDKVYFEQITTAQGLSQNTVISICQDSFGFMWFGTYNGLNRYDGYKIKRYEYDRNDSNSISHNAIEDIIVDGNGVLWFATMNGLCQFDYHTEEFTRYQNKPGDDRSLGRNKLRSLYEDRKGNLWIGTYGDGLDLMNRSTKEFTHFKHDSTDSCSISNSYVSRVFEDSHGNLWVATDGGLNLLDRKTGKFKHYQNVQGNPHSLSHDHVSCIFQDKYGDLWIGTWDGGLNRLKNGYQNKLEEKNLEFIRYNSKNPDSISNNIIHDIIEDRSGNLWIATRGGGINCYDREKNQFIQYVHSFEDPHSLSNNMVGKLFEDKSGVLWAGTYGGVNKYDPHLKKFKLYQVNPADTNTYIFYSIYSLFVDPTAQGDIVWLGSQSEGLSRWNRIDDSIKRYKPDPNNPSMLPSGFIPVIITDRSGQLWMGTGSGLSRFDKEKEKFHNYSADPANPHGLSRKDVYSLCEDQDKRLWIGTYEGGLNCLDLNIPENSDPEKAHFIRFVRNPDDPNSISDMSVRDIHQDKNGILWLGTERGGLNRLDQYDSANSKFTSMLSDSKDPDTLSNNYVRCIYEANDGVLWIGTANGLNRLDPNEKIKRNPKFKHYSGLSSNSIHEILQDTKGCLWISTDRGISKFDPITGKFHNFGPKDGLQSEEFANNVYGIGNSGIMYFGGSDGLNIFDPNRITTDPCAPPVVITDFQISNQSVPIGPFKSQQTKKDRTILLKSIVETNEIKLSYEDKVISFEFAGLNYGSPANNQYAYYMEGFDTNWIDAGTTRKATYTNLDPSEYKSYKFKVKASNSDGVWNEEGETLIIHIKPPFYKTLWFKYLVCPFVIGLIVVAGSYLIIRFWHRRIKSRHDELIKNEKAKRDVAKRTVGRIAHELGTPIGEIEFNLHSMSAGNVPSNLVNKIYKIISSAERMKAIMQAMTEIEILEGLISDLSYISMHPSIKSIDTSVNTLVQTAIMAVKETRNKENVKFSIQYSGNTKIQCYPNEIIQVFINLLRNSYDAILADKKKKRDLKKEGVIKVATTNREDIIQIVIQDNGEGIPEMNKDKIFEEGFTTRSGPGRGFGLAVAKNMVGRNNGKLKIENDIANGEITGCIAIVEFPKAIEAIEK